MTRDTVLNLCDYVALLHSTAPIRGHMITPEFVREEHGEFVFVANHNLETEDNVTMSIDYNRARILNARRQLPPTLSRCRLIYDVRGQTLWTGALERIRLALADACTIEVKR